MNTTERPATYLETLRDEMGLTLAGDHTPAWRIEKADDRFSWIFDGDKAVALLDEKDDVIELRCHGPESECPPPIVPKHYHTPAYEGARIIYTWRLGGHGHGDKLSTDLTTTVEDGTPVITCEQHWADGTVCISTIRMSVDPKWGAYVMDVEAVLDARRATTILEYCNILPASIGDSRPGRERFPLTYWKHPDGLKKMIKNPLWFNSVGSQDATGEKHIEQGGFLGFGPDARLNPVIEVVRSDPESGAGTCDNLQDEHIFAFPAEGRHAKKTGWFHLEAHYRLFSIPVAMAERIAEMAQPMDHGAMHAWKFQYPATPELPADLTRVELPGSPFYGPSDWSQPIPWDEPYNGVLWTASPDPDAAIHYDRKVGRDKPGSIRLRVDGNEIAFAPGSGHTLHTDQGENYRYSMWIRTEGDVRAWIEADDMLFRCGDGKTYTSDKIGPDTDWQSVQVEFTGRGDDAPFARTAVHVEGTGIAWFTDMMFERA